MSQFAREPAEKDTGIPADRQTGAPMVVDVRDMMCAQALARVGAAAQRLAPGDAVTVLYNADDVARDLAVWIADRGYRMTQHDHASVTFQR